MRLSAFYLPILKENPAEAQIASHRLMLRAGMIRQLSAGIYVWLPLGLKVLRNIERVVREEMDAAGVQELLMPCIQPARLWQESGRYDSYGREMLRITDRHDQPLLFGPTNEEVITDLFRHTVKSYKSLPKRLYHIQWKFRDEIRPRFGIMRGREFLMKDAYSFDLDADSARASYMHFFRAYLRLFRRLGVDAIPVRAETGPIGGDLSHEFHIVAKTGESALYYDEAFEALRGEGSAALPEPEQMLSLYAAADEMHDPAACPLPPEKLREARGIEVGHIFYFGTKYSGPLKAAVAAAEGGTAPVHGGAYGIGVSRLVGAMIEAFHDEKGIVWPEEVAPFVCAVVNLKPGEDACDRASESLYETLRAQGLPVLYDDTKGSTGAKLTTLELIGVPWLAVVGPRGIEGGMVELRHRATGQREEVSLESACSLLAGKIGRMRVTGRAAA